MLSTRRNDFVRAMIAMETLLLRLRLIRRGVRAMVKMVIMTYIHVVDELDNV